LFSRECESGREDILRYDTVTSICFERDYETKT
jgi:hypothetical protein